MERQTGGEERKISDATHLKKKNFQVYFLIHFSFTGGSDLQHSAKLCSCGNEEYVKMSEMQGCQLKQIKLSPAPHSEHTWCAHAHHTTPHTDAQSSHSQLSTSSGQCRKIMIESCRTYSRVHSKADHCK